MCSSDLNPAFAKNQGANNALLNQISADVILALSELDQEAQTESGETGADSERANSEEITSEDIDKLSCPNQDLLLEIVAIFCVISTFL